MIGDRSISKCLELSPKLSALRSMIDSGQDTPADSWRTSMLIATIVLSILLGLLFIVTGGMKLGSVPQSLAIRDHLGVKPELWRAIGFCEAAGGVGLLVGLSLPVLGLAASIGLIVLMIGAIVSRVRVADPVTMISVDVLVLALVVALMTIRALAA
ncbi:DoxX family protein [Nonomuraea sp. NPDC049028]|uniref:DoxX family protein n=1 Tax=Nonomuraea sp. NPDC049028 TaxID=3364348 RepID=UPI0037247545